MTDRDIALAFPADLSSERRRLLDDTAARNLAEHGDGLVGMVLSGSG